MPSARTSLAAPGTGALPILNPLFSIFAFISAWLAAVGPRCRAATDDRQVVPTTILNPLFSIFAFISIFAFSL
jgi:hypothetical protein